MAITLIRALLFVAGGLAAATSTAYVSGALDPYLNREPAPVASLPDGPAAQPDAKTARLPGQEPPAAAAPATPMAEQPAAEASAPADSPVPAASAPEGVVAPSFDVVRVEGDGSIVIAGKAAPGAKVEIVIGSDVIGQAVAGPGGDFAVVLEDPLDPGGYQIVLRSTTPDNVVAMSVETAVVSVPETANGQVLALVEEPGKPSEMISLPQPELPDANAQANAPASQQPAAEQPEAGEEATSGPAPEQPAATEPEAQTEAALQPETTAPATNPDAAKPMVVVEAVEIEGRTIFVAGSADPGRKVRGYANDILLGDAEASPGGQFLIEAERDLPVGDYIIRVDALEPDGAKVAARAAVPFEREPGESISAVAPPALAAEAPAVEPNPITEAPAAPEAPAIADAPIAPATPPAPVTNDAPEAVQPPAVAEAPSVTADAPPAVEPVQPGSAEAVAEAPPAELSEPGTDDSMAQAPVDEPVQGGTAAEAPAAAQAPAVAGSSAGEAPAATTPAPAVATAPEATPTSPPAAGAPTPSIEPEVDTAEAPAAAATETAPLAEGVPTTTAPKLQSVKGAVIIRRGDTLWRISRRVYGRGIRYSTIYLANQKQIEDPDRIWPGQVFTVPKKTSEGVAADMTRIGDQATTVPQ